MKKAFLVTFSITTRVIADDVPEAEEKAVDPAIKEEASLIDLSNWENTELDIEHPFDIEDMEFVLFPNLDPLTPEQEILVAQAWEMHQREIKQYEDAAKPNEIINAQENITKAANTWRDIMDQYSGKN